MPSRRHIRETVVQFLYCAHLEGGANPRDWRDTFWEFVTESDRRRLLVATNRTVTHLSQGRDQRLAEWIERLPAARAKIAARPEASALGDMLTRVEELEARWSTAHDQLRRLPVDDADDEVAARLDVALGALFRIDRELAAARGRWLEALEDHPALRGPLEPVAASLRRLQRVSDRLRMVEQPERFPEQSDLAHLRESREELAALRQAADPIAEAVLAHAGEIDAALAAVIDNYAPERVDPVDRAILRLGGWELRHRPETPPAVVINEAVEIARRFGSKDSPRFVNGILDRLAKPPQAAV